MDSIKHYKSLNRGTEGPCIVNSVINSLVKGPPISAGDKINLWKFADSATRALATVTSMDWLSQVNQGNIVNMTEQLPKPLQDKFATLWILLPNVDNREALLS